MADLNPISFLLNQSEGSKKSADVEAPAFSLTKVLATVAAVVAPVVTVVVDKATNVNLTNWNWVALAIGVLGFLAITASADVLARSRATAAAANLKAAQMLQGHFVQFPNELDAHYDNHDAKVIGFANGSDQFYLVKKANGDVKWVKKGEVQVGKP